MSEKTELDDATVERAARALWRRWNPNGPRWDRTTGQARDDARGDARAALAAARAGEVVEVGDAFGEVVAVVQAAVKAAVRNIPGHVSDRAAEGIARAALHAFTPRLAVLLREAEARGAARGDATPTVTEWRVLMADEARERGGTSAPYTYCERDEARARRLYGRPEYVAIERRTVGAWEVQP